MATVTIVPPTVRVEFTRNEKVAGLLRDADPGPLLRRRGLAR